MKTPVWVWTPVFLPEKTVETKPLNQICVRATLSIWWMLRMQSSCQQYRDRKITCCDSFVLAVKCFIAGPFSALTQANTCQPTVNTGLLLTDVLILKNFLPQSLISLSGAILFGIYSVTCCSCLCTGCNLTSKFFRLKEQYYSGEAIELPWGSQVECEEPVMYKSGSRVSKKACGTSMSLSDNVSI